MPLAGSSILRSRRRFPAPPPFALMFPSLYQQPSLRFYTRHHPSLSRAQRSRTPRTISLSLYLPLPFTREDPPGLSFAVASSFSFFLFLSPLPPLSLSFRCLTFFEASLWRLFFRPDRVLGTVLEALARAEKCRLERATCAARQIKTG